jgi:hypothetical protein
MDIRHIARSWTAKRQAEAGKPQTVSMYVHFPFRVTLANSTIRQAADGAHVVEQRALPSKQKPIDPDCMLEDFLALKRSDRELLSFLNKYGLWDDEQAFEVNEFWDFQEFLRVLMALKPASRGKMLSRSGFGKLPGPLNKRLIVDFEYNLGGLHFVVNTSGCLEAIIALAQIDLSKQTKHRKCARKDCPVIFSVSTGDKRRDSRKYHHRKCAHLDVVRRSRVPE